MQNNTVKRNLVDPKHEALEAAYAPQHFKRMKTEAPEKNTVRVSPDRSMYSEASDVQQTYAERLKIVGLPAFQKTLSSGGTLADAATAAAQAAIASGYTPDQSRTVASMNIFSLLIAQGHSTYDAGEQCREISQNIQM